MEYKTFSLCCSDFWANKFLETLFTIFFSIFWTILNKLEFILAWATFKLIIGKKKFLKKEVDKKEGSFERLVPAI